MVFNWSRTISHLGVLSLRKQKVCIFHILGAILDSKLTVVPQAGKLFDRPHVLKSCFNAYVLSGLRYCASVWMLLRSLIWVCWTVFSQCGKVVWGWALLFGSQKEGPCLVFDLSQGYLNYFVAARNTRTSAALCEWALVILRYRTDQFNRSLLLAAVSLWNLLP